MDLFRCEFCDVGIRPQDGHAVRLVTAWVYAAGAGRKVHSVDQDHYRYVHDFCLEAARRGAAQDGLF